MAELSTINRFAVMLIPTQACLDWANSCPADDSHMTLDDMQREPAVFLISVSEAGFEEHLRRHYRVMFEEELYSWCTDPSLWPSDLSFKNFKRFFTVHTASMVFDLGKGRIIKDEP